MADSVDGLGAQDEGETLAEAPAILRHAPSLLVPREGTPESAVRALAAEVPVSITYNGVAYAVMMASPADLEDFAVGFSLTEQVVEAAGEIESVDLRPVERGVLAQVRIPQARARALMENRRNLVGQTGCGICGIVELEQAVRRYGANTRAPVIGTQALFKALDALAPLQELNARTGAAHAAGFADPSGGLVAVREDVGRHNALDKIFGHLARAGISPSSGFLLVTSRISFELVQKCLAAGATALAGISAPTALAVDLAGAHGLTLVALARADSIQVFCDPFGVWRGGPAGPVDPA